MQINSINNTNFGKYMVSQEAHSMIDYTPHENIIYDSKVMLDCVRDAINEYGDSLCLTIDKDNLNLVLEDEKGAKGLTTFMDVEEYADNPFEVLSGAFVRFLVAFKIDLSDVLHNIITKYDERVKDEYTKNK